MSLIFAEQPPPQTETDLAEWLNRFQVQANIFASANIFNNNLISQTLLDASDLTVQEPVALDTVRQITYGPAQNGPTDIVMLDALGNITINRTGFYHMTLSAQYGRQGSSGGTSRMYLRLLINDIQAGNSAYAEILNPNVNFPIQFEGVAFLDAGTVIKTEIYRDSAGVNQGGLYPALSPGLGWNAAPSSVVRIHRIVDL